MGSPARRVHRGGRCSRQVSSSQGAPCKYIVEMERIGANPTWELDQTLPTRWFPGFRSGRQSWGCLLEQLFRARSLQRRTNESEFCILGDQPNEWGAAKEMTTRFLEWTKIFFGKAESWDCLLELIRAWSLQQGIHESGCERGQRMWAMNNWEWMWRETILVLIGWDWIKRESRRDSWRGELRTSVTWTWLRSAIHTCGMSSFHTYVWHEKMLIITKTLNWKAFSNKWVKARSHNW